MLLCNPDNIFLLRSTGLFSENKLSINCLQNFNWLFLTNFWSDNMRIEKTCIYQMKKKNNLCYIFTCFWSVKYQPHPCFDCKCQQLMRFFYVHLLLQLLSHYLQHTYSSCIHLSCSSSKWTLYLFYFQSYNAISDFQFCILFVNIFG